MILRKVIVWFNCGETATEAQKEALELEFDRLAELVSEYAKGQVLHLKKFPQYAPANPEVRSEIT